MTDVVTIGGIAAGGDGVGRLGDGRAVFVPRTVPGDRVALKPGFKLYRNFARAELGELLESGRGRVVPPCHHYVEDRCGGCQLQHLAYDAQLETKRTIVGDALRRIGKLDVPDPEIVEAIDEWRYRSRVSLSTKRATPGHEIVVGLHPHDHPGAVFPLSDCQITDVRLMDLWREMKEHLDLLPTHASRVTLRLDRGAGRHIIVESAGAPWDRGAQLCAALGRGVVCWWQPPDGAARVVAGPATGYPATAFEQVNPEMGAVARAWGVQQLGEIRSQVVWDLYGGIGDTAALLADQGAEVVSVDADEQAVAWAGRRSLPSPVRFIAGRAEDVLDGLPDPVAVTVNPPRAGLHWNVTLRLRERPVKRVVYVSCDPATLARDLQRLSVTYRIVALRAFDLFPQTAHVETVVALEAA